MISIYEEKNSKAIRIRITEKDLDELRISKETSLAAVKNWIDLGIENAAAKSKNSDDDLRKILLGIGQKLDSLIYLSLQVFEPILIPGTLEHLDSIEFLSRSGLPGPIECRDKNHFIYRAEIAKHKTKKFREMAQNLFPNIELGKLMYAKADGIYEAIFGEKS